MSEAVVVAIITLVMGGLMGYGTTAYLRQVNTAHDNRIDHDLTIERLQRELLRTYERIDSGHVEIAPTPPKVSAPPPKDPAVETWELLTDDDRRWFAANLYDGPTKP